jgi:hypothetical protein
MDMPGAYLNADIRKEVLISIEPRLAELLVAMHPEVYEKHLRNDGVLVVRLKKGLYGLAESAKLWNEKLIYDLKTLGFKQNPKEPCVLNKYVNHEQLTVCVYVDDLLSTCKSMNALKWFHDQMCKFYGNVALNDGKILSYLGQTFNFTVPGKYHITMEGYVLDLLNLEQTDGSAAIPALEDLFEIDASSNLLSMDNKDHFHSNVAKLLYLSQGVRPDLLSAVNFLRLG